MNSVPVNERYNMYTITTERRCYQMLYHDVFCYLQKYTIFIISTVARICDEINLVWGFFHSLDINV